MSPLGAFRTGITHHETGSYGSACGGPPQPGTLTFVGAPAGAGPRRRMGHCRNALSRTGTRSMQVDRCVGPHSERINGRSGDDIQDASAVASARARPASAASETATRRDGRGLLALRRGVPRSGSSAPRLDTRRPAPATPSRRPPTAWPPSVSWSSSSNRPVATSKANTEVSRCAQVRTDEMAHRDKPTGNGQGPADQRFDQALNLRPLCALQRSWRGSASPGWGRALAWEPSPNSYARHAGRLATARCRGFGRTRCRNAHAAAGARSSESGTMANPDRPPRTKSPVHPGPTRSRRLGREWTPGGVGPQFIRWPLSRGMAVAPASSETRS